MDFPSFEGFYAWIVISVHVVIRLGHSEHSYSIYSFVSKNKTGKNWNDEKINQTDITVKKLHKSRCQRNCDPSSSWQSLVIALMQASCSPILSEWKATTAGFWGRFHPKQSSCFCEFDCRSFMKHTS